MTGTISLSDTLITKFSREKVNDIIDLVEMYEDFTPDNDPYGEHDFGQFDFEDITIFWKIDYYDKNLQYGSSAPEDPEKTRRVLTIMTAQDY